MATNKKTSNSCYRGTLEAEAALTFKLGKCAEQNWRKLRGFDYLAKVTTGVAFKDGIETTNQARSPHEQQPSNTRFDNNSYGLMFKFDRTVQKSY